jgi:electron transport complex protein RnfG
MKPIFGYVGQARLILALAGLFGASLALVQAGLAPRIEANKQAETQRQVPVLVPGAAHAEPSPWRGRPALHAEDEDGADRGWVIPATGAGFAGPIEILIGLNVDATQITGLYVLSQVETPGLGNRITETPWLDQFRGRSTGTPLTLKQIDGISGATISSESVVSAVNGALGPSPSEGANP